MAIILIVEDEKLLRWALKRQLEQAGHKVYAAENLAEGGHCLTTHQPDVLLLDLGLPDGHGLDFYEQNAERLEGTVVIVMTALGAVDEAVRAMKLGALDFITKPVNQDELVALVNRSIAVKGERLEVQVARKTRERDLSQEVVAESEAFAQVLAVAEQVADSDVGSILIQGESGTGKNVVARHVHAVSARRSKPVLEVSCATIPENLLESELFGHEKGAFTDAKATKRGTFELGAGGTVVLDEIGELRLDLQAKLLHFLEERRFRRVGGTREIQVDVRIIALTNRDLREMVRDSSFRNDLFYRLNVFPITLPPLRERPEDIVALSHHFLETLQPNLSKRFEGIDREAENRLLGYSWPGNVRELRNVIERAMVLERSPELTSTSLILDWMGGPGPAVEPSDDGGGGMPTGIVPLEEIEREMVARAMRATNDNQTRAAELLNITRDQLRYRLGKFGMRNEPGTEP